MPCSKVDILTLLDAYSQAHEEAQKGQKAAVWQLTKARHSKGRRGALVDGILQADDVREELRARKYLKKNVSVLEPTLLDEADAVCDTEKAPSASLKKHDQSSSLEIIQARFLLVDAVEEERKQRQQREEKVGATPSSDDNASMGLRRRKGSNKENEDEKTATGVEQQGWTLLENNVEDEEDRLCNADPMDFFEALPPKELRKAQEEARKSLEAYVKAANVLFALQERLRTK
jgi:hypothetical protein